MVPQSFEGCLQLKPLGRVMTSMVANKKRIFEVLDYAPPQWHEGYTPVKYKRAFVDKWEQNPFTLDEVVEQDGTGIGLILGELTETVAIDFDGEGSKESFKDFFGHGVDELPETISWSSGRPHRHQRAYLVPRKFWPLVHHLQNDIDKVEIRWNDHQSVLLGTHPNDKIGERKVQIGQGDGKGFYNFLPHCSPENINIAIAPDWFLNTWAEYCEPKRSELPLFKESRTDLLHDSSRVKRYLFELLQPANLFQEHKYWNPIGMGLHYVSSRLGDPWKHYPDWLKWSSQMDNFDEAQCKKVWASFGKKKAAPKDQKKFGTVVGIYQAAVKEGKIQTPKVEITEHIEETPKRTHSQLLEDIYQALVNKDQDSFRADLAEMDTRFKRKEKDIRTELLDILRKKKTNKTYTVGAVDLDKVKSLEYLLEGFLVKGEIIHLFAPWGTGKTALALGMAKAGALGVPFLDQERERDPFKSLFIQVDAGASRFKETYFSLGIDEEEEVKNRLTVWAPDASQGTKGWKCDLWGLCELYEQVEKLGVQCIFIDSCKGMMSGTGFDYKDNEQIDLMVQYLREIICQQLDVCIVLLNHKGKDSGEGAGAKRWSEASGQVIELKNVKDEKGKDLSNERELGIPKPAIGSRRFFKYTLVENEFELCNPDDSKSNCNEAIYHQLIKWNKETDKTIFTRKDFLSIPNYERAHIDRTVKELTEGRHSVLTKVGRGKYQLKPSYRG